MCKCQQLLGVTIAERQRDIEREREREREREGERQRKRERERGPLYHLAIPSSNTMLVWLQSSAKTYRKREYARVPFSGYRNRRVNRELQSDLVDRISSAHSLPAWQSHTYSLVHAAAKLKPLRQLDATQILEPLDREQRLFWCAHGVAADQLWILEIVAIEPLPEPVRADHLRCPGAGHVYSRMTTIASQEICSFWGHSVPAWLQGHTGKIKLCVSLPGALLQLFCKGLATHVLVPSPFQTSFGKVPASLLMSRAGQSLRQCRDTLVANQTVPPACEEMAGAKGFGSDLSPLSLYP